jgi:hypothetical protein
MRLRPNFPGLFAAFLCIALAPQAHADSMRAPVESSQTATFRCPGIVADVEIAWREIGAIREHTRFSFRLDGVEQIDPEMSEGSRHALDALWARTWWQHLAPAGVCTSAGDKIAVQITALAGSDELYRFALFSGGLVTGNEPELLVWRSGEYLPIAEIAAGR